MPHTNPPSDTPTKHMCNHTCIPLNEAADRHISNTFPLASLHKETAARQATGFCQVDSPAKYLLPHADWLIYEKLARYLQWCEVALRQSRLMKVCCGM